MEKVVGIGSVKEQDKFRREDMRKMPPNKRVELLINMQRKAFDWNSNPRFIRTATVKRLSN